MQPTTWDLFWHPQNVPILFYPGFELQDGMTCCDSQEGRFVGIPLRDLKKFLVFMQEFCGKSILGEPATQGDWGLSVRWIFDLDNRIYLSPCLPLQNIWPLGLYKHGFMQMYTAYFSGSGSACHSVSWEGDIVNIVDMSSPAGPAGCWDVPSFRKTVSWHGVPKKVFCCDDLWISLAAIVTW